MRAARLVFAAAGVAWLLALPAGSASARRAQAQHRVAIFYYPWYGNVLTDGDYEMWPQNGHDPPGDIYSAFFPARGVYSSSDPHLVDRQLAEIAASGIDQLVVSWWGRGSRTDARLEPVLLAAHRIGLDVAVHVEPYPGRTAATVAADVQYLAGLGVHTLYVFDAEAIASGDWAAMRPTLEGTTLLAQTGHAGWAAAAAFDGIYTYDIVTYGPGKFARLCAQARALHLLCEPSVGPGYDAIRADGDVRLKPRRAGATYDGMWRAALRAHPDAVTITSYNEWGEGTQIEPARSRAGYLSYEGAWGLHGAAASKAYLTRTGYWAARLHALG
jgi:glycoprotein endo-alpha-1,2-mannosidase